MKRFYKLSLFTVIILVFMGLAYGLIERLENVIFEQGERDMRTLQKSQLALVIVNFHSYYHVWPCKQGPLEIEALTELGGFGDAKINTQHINFFDANGSDMDLLDRNGKALLFRPDESIGTCTVYELPNDKN